MRKARKSLPKVLGSQSLDNLPPVRTKVDRHGDFTPRNSHNGRFSGGIRFDVPRHHERHERSSAAPVPRAHHVQRRSDDRVCADRPLRVAIRIAPATRNLRLAGTPCSGPQRMTTTTPSQQFPCPFCQSKRVVLIGGGPAFLHYRCPDCSEVWTAMKIMTRRVVAAATATMTRH